MKIVFLDTAPIRRGAQVFVEELSISLEENGHLTQRMYLFLPKGDLTVGLREQDRVLAFKEESLLEKIPTFQPRLLRRLAKEIAKFKPEVIVLNGSKTLKYGAWLKILGMCGRAKLVGRFIDDAIFWNQGGIKKRMYSYWINQLDALVGVSQTSLDSALLHYGFRKPSQVIHRVFDPKKFVNALGREEARRVLKLSEKDEVLLFLGNLTAQKRPDRFIEIVKRLAQIRPNLKALIVGDGPLIKDMENLLSNNKYQVSGIKSQKTRDKSRERGTDFGNSNVLGLASSISFLGYQQDVSPYLSAADILVLTSDTEGLPGVVLEAAYFQVPTVASEVGGIKECLINGETGFLIPDRSVDVFCRNIDYLLAHPEDRKRMGKRARAFVMQNFQMEKVAGQYLEFFGSLR